MSVSKKKKKSQCFSNKELMAGKHLVKNIDMMSIIQYSGTAKGEGKIFSLILQENPSNWSVLHFSRESAPLNQVGIILTESYIFARKKKNCHITELAYLPYQRLSSADYARSRKIAVHLSFHLLIYFFRYSENHSLKILLAQEKRSKSRYYLNVI